MESNSASDWLDEDEKEILFLSSVTECTLLQHSIPTTALGVFNFLSGAFAGE